MLKLFNYLINVFLAEAYYSPVIYDHIRKECICSIVIINLLVGDISLLATTFNAPRHGEHFVNAKDHEGATGDAKNSCLPAHDKSTNKSHYDYYKELKNDHNYFWSHAIKIGDVLCNNFCNIARSAVFSVKPADLFVKNFSYELNSYLLCHLFAHDSKKTLIKCSHKHDDNDSAESYDNPHNCTCFPVFVRFVPLKGEL